MEAIKDYGGEPVRNDLGTMLLLVVACPFGLLMWAALFSAVQWLIVCIWGVAVSFAASPATINANPDRPLPASYFAPAVALPEPRTHVETEAR